VALTRPTDDVKAITFGQLFNIEDIPAFAGRVRSGHRRGLHYRSARRHIANWLIGQVRDGTQTEDKIRAYAREIGADESEMVEAFRQVPTMSHAQFEKIAQALFTLAKQLSATAYQNVQQARFITDREQVEKVIHDLNDRFEIATDSAQIGVWDLDLIDNVLVWNDWMYRLYGVDPKNFEGAYEAWENGVHPEDFPQADEEVQQAIKGAGAKESSRDTRWDRYSLFLSRG
jgi:PAS domain-containing protein